MLDLHQKEIAMSKLKLRILALMAAVALAGMALWLCLAGGQPQTPVVQAAPAEELSVRLQAQTVITHHNFLPVVSRAPLAPPGPQPVPDDWLGAVNYYRALAAVPPVTELEYVTWWQDLGDQVPAGDACRKHARYMVKTDAGGHYEDPSSPWYTPEGERAGRSSNVGVSADMGRTDAVGIGRFASAPFHALNWIGPLVTQVAFGSYRENTGTFKAGFVLMPHYQTGEQRYPDSVHLPLQYPTNGAYTTLLQYGGGENPDPLTACPGYSPPSGPPIMIMFGNRHFTHHWLREVLAHSFSENGQPVEHCLFYGDTYTHPDPYWRDDVRGLLRNSETAVLMPRRPLIPGAGYTVSISVLLLPYPYDDPDGITETVTSTWSFTSFQP